MRNVMLAALVLLGACGARERVTGSTPDNVMIEVDGIVGRPQVAMELAAAECRRHGRQRAVVTQVQRVHPWEYWLAECR